MARWYSTQRGDDFARSFSKDIEDTITLLATMPTIGRQRKQQGTKTYRLYRNHRRCTVYYWHDDHEVRIIDLLFTEQTYRP